MPAGSDAPPLPHTWRPLGVRLAMLFFGGLLLLLCAFAWFGFDAETRARFTLLQRTTLVALALLAGSVCYALVRSRVTASEAGLTVVNGYRRRDYEWAEVVAIHLPQGAPWATLDLADGTTAAVMALQGSDGDRARVAVRQLRALIDRPG
jgi:hypothetical protein